MNMKKSVMLLSSVLALAACDNPFSSGGEQNTQQTAASSQAATSTSPAPVAEPAVTELKTTDGVIVIKTTGEFVDKLGDEEMRPEGVQPEQLLLLQHNDSNNVTVYAVDFGAAKYKSSDYFAKLKKALENTKGLQNVKVDDASEQRMDYRFSQGKDGEFGLNESCAALVAANKVYSVCASSPEMSVEGLAQVIQDISVVGAVETAQASAPTAASEVVSASAASVAK